MRLAETDDLGRPARDRLEGLVGGQPERDRATTSAAAEPRRSSSRPWRERSPPGASWRKRFGCAPHSSAAFDLGGFGPVVILRIPFGEKLFRGLPTSCKDVELRHEPHVFHDALCFRTYSQLLPRTLTGQPGPCCPTVPHAPHPKPAREGVATEKDARRNALAERAGRNDALTSTQDSPRIQKPRQLP